MNKLILVFVMVLLVGCTVPFEQNKCISMRDFEKVCAPVVPGKHIDELIVRWGPPNQDVISDGRGGHIYTWSWGGERWYSVTVKSYRIFWVDSNGIIYKWAWKK